MHELVNEPRMLWIVIGYLGILLLVGWYFYNKAKKSGQEGKDDFFLAGRSLSKLVAIGTILATYTGGGTVTGGGNSLAYNFGFWPGLFFVTPPILSMLVLVWLAPKIRSGGHTTVAQMIEAKYGSAARFFASIIIGLSMISIVSYQYRGLGFILNATTGISVATCTMICCIIVILLAFSGGLKTVAATDTLSAFLMVFGLVIGLPPLIKAVGGVDWVLKLHKNSSTITDLRRTDCYRLAGRLSSAIFLTIGDQNYYRIAHQKTLNSLHRPTRCIKLHGDNASSSWLRFIACIYLVQILLPDRL